MYSSAQEHPGRVFAAVVESWNRRVTESQGHGNAVSLCRRVAESPSRNTDWCVTIADAGTPVKGCGQS